MRKTCLILAESDDVHVLKVLEYGADYPDWSYIVLDTATALNELRTTLQLDVKHPSWMGNFCGLPLSSIQSIWYRRPKRPTAQDDIMDPSMKKLAEAEMQAVLQNFYRITPCRILPHPSRDREADYKLLQLQTAASIGPTVPQTVISNEESWLDLFPSSTNDFCIKALSSFHWWSNEFSEYSLRSAKVSKADLLHYINDSGICPVLVQEYVEKKYEWRVTVIDKSIFACRLDSQQVKGAQEDCRQVDVDLIPHQICDLPDMVANKLLCYLDFFDLKFGAFDLIEKPDGTFVFLKCNPNGQWLWVELLTGTPISKAIADYLFGQ